MTSVSIFSALARTQVTRKSVMSPVGRGGWFPIIREPQTGAWQRNGERNAEDSLSSPIVYACVTLIANDIGKLRSRIVEKNSDGIWTEDRGRSKLWAPVRKPNRHQNHIQFKQWWITSKLRAGNAYVLKERDAHGNVIRLYVLDPRVVTPLVADDGSVYYQLGHDNLSGVQPGGVTVPASAIIHDRMNCLYHPLVGIPPLYAASLAAGVSVNIQQNAAYFFGNSARPSGILVAPGNIDEENAREIKAAWEQGYTGSNAGRVAVLGDGMKFEPLSQTATDSQLVETLRWSDERICSVFHVPPYKVGVGSAPSYNNIEALERGYYAGCLQVMIEEMEACLDDGLGLDGVTAGIELDLDGLLRMDTKTQMESLKIGVDAGLVAPNEGRSRINLPPLEGGDTVYLQQQDFPLDQVRQNRIVPASSNEPPPAQPAKSASDASAGNDGFAAAMILAPLFARIAELESAQRKLTESFEGMLAEVSKRISDIPAPRDGTDVDMSVVLRRVDELVSEIPRPRDGTSVTLDDVEPVVLRAVERAVSQIPVPRDGTDVDMSVVLRRVDELVSEIPRPRDGTSVTLDDVEPVVLRAVERAVSQIPVPRDGASVTMDDVAPVLEAAQARWELAFERRAFDVMQRSIEKMPVPQDGKDGLGFEDLSVEYDGSRTITLKFEREGVVKEAHIVMPLVLDCGIYRVGSEYQVGDGVTYGGSYWIAQKSGELGKPGDARDDWRLAVKKGRDAREAVRIDGQHDRRPDSAKS